MTSQEKFLFGIKAFFTVAAVFALAVAVVRPVLKSLMAHPVTHEQNFELKLPEDEELEIPLGGPAGKVGRDGMIKSARENPQVTAQMISNWLRQKK